MSAPYVGEVRMFAGTFAPRDYADCNGTLINIQQNTMLFAILGVIYGGDGRNTFALPDFQGKIPVGYGHGPGLSDYRDGARGGSDTHTLSTSQMPSHTHTLSASTVDATSDSPSGNVLANVTAGNIYSTAAPDASMASNAVTNVGGGNSYNNQQPFLAIRFIIATVGAFPSH